jgi:hypothetical protein
VEAVKLNYPNSNDTFILVTDASDNSIGAELKGDSPSALIWVFPGRCCMTILYWANSSIHLASCPSIFLKFKSHIRLLWSVLSNWIDSLSNKEIQEEQMHDPDLKPILLWIQDNYEPSMMELKLSSKATRYYWMCRSWFYKQFTDPSHPIPQYMLF